MKVTTTPSPRSTVLLQVELPADRLQRSIDESVRHLGRRKRVPGFRPGKVPRPMLERALGVRRGNPDGPNPIHEDAKEHLFEASVVEAVREADLDPLAIPEPEWTAFEEGKGASYRLTLPIRPEVRLGAYTGYPFGLQVEEPDEGAVERVFGELRDQHASLVPVEDRGAEESDYAVIAFEGSRNGEPVEGLKAERFPLVIGSERIIPGFEAQLVGLREDDEKTFSLTFPDDYPEESLRGQAVDFRVTLRELRRKQLPDADDDFAQGLGDYADLAALKEQIRKRLEANARDRARHAFADRILEFAAANATVELPDLLVEREIEVMFDELKVRLAEQGISWEAYLKVTERDEAKLHDEYREPAEKRVKTLLVVGAIADAEGIEISDEELDREVARAKRSYPDNPKLAGYFDTPRGRAYLRSTLRRSQTVETLVDRWLAEHPEVGPVPHLHEPDHEGTDRP
jgi:trigger factor